MTHWVRYWLTVEVPARGAVAIAMLDAYGSDVYRFEAALTTTSHRIAGPITVWVNGSPYVFAVKSDAIGMIRSLVDRAPERYRSLFLEQLPLLERAVEG